jgi:hypothetical protein
LKNEFSAIKVIKKLSEYIKGGGNDRFVSGIIEKNFEFGFIIDLIKKNL